MVESSGAGHKARPARLFGLVAAVVLASGCGGRHEAAKAPPVKPASTTVAQVGLRVAVVGPIDVQVPGAIVTRRPLRKTGSQSLVLVSAASPAAAGVPQDAAAHPSTHYVIIGASAAQQRLPNLAGAVLRDDQAARLGGIAAGLSAQEASRAPRVAWVGPRDPALVAAFVAGVQQVAPGTTILRAWSSPRPASCKESALGAIERGATVVMASRGLCAAAAVDGAHERNVPGVALSDFQLPNVAAESIARDGVRGVFYGREDLIFGRTSGAIGVRRLDPLFSETVASRTRSLAQQLVSGGSPSG